MQSARVRWELSAAIGLMIAYALTRPSIHANGIPYLLDRGVFAFILDLILLASAFGLSVSVARRKDAPERIAGVACLVLSLILLLDWGHFLLNWRLRPWE